jgi:hypothetical protein
VTDCQAPLAHSAEDNARDAAKWRALCAATKAILNSDTRYSNFAGGQDNLAAGVSWQHKGVSGMHMTLTWEADNEVCDDLNGALKPGAALF